ncbi:Lrp/AsnC family transcriptional regulator [Candidatus Woesearchaeota archaeon]|nr:Lrp/AsnC family transcriptional regulator [Candidatus Woesearchaeota archaeon]
MNDISYNPPVKLDAKDKKILELLSQDARMPVSEISKKSKIQRDSVVYRIKRLEKFKVIRFYTAILNPSVLGFPIYSYVHIKLHNLDETIEKQFVAFLIANPQVTYVVKISGEWDYDITIAARDLGNFEEVLKEIRYKFSKIIQNYSSDLILQEYKYDYLIDLINVKNL